MLTQGQFLYDVETFMQRSGVAPTKLGREAIGDPRFVHDLRSGRVPNLRTVERIWSWISAYRPTDNALSRSSLASIIPSDPSEVSESSPEISVFCSESSEPSPKHAEGDS